MFNIKKNTNVNVGIQIFAADRCLVTKMSSFTHYNLSLCHVMTDYL